MARKTTLLRALSILVLLAFLVHLALSSTRVSAGEEKEKEEHKKAAKAAGLAAFYLGIVFNVLFAHL